MLANRIRMGGAGIDEYVKMRPQDLFFNDYWWHLEYRGENKYVEIPESMMDYEYLYEDEGYTDVVNFRTSRIFAEAEILGVKTTTPFITDLSAMFNRAKGDILDVNGLLVDNVKNLSSTFAETEHHTIILDKWDTSNVDPMHGTFFGVNLHELDLSHFDTKKVTNVSNMFKEATIGDLDLTGFNLANITNKSDMFLNANIGTLRVATQQDADIAISLGLSLDTEIIVK